MRWPITQLTDSAAPMPEGLARNSLGLPDKDFHRLSVAFGLTYDPVMIGKIYRSWETPNVTLQQKRRVDRDDLYTR